MKALALGIAIIGLFAVAVADDARAQIEASNKVIGKAMMKKDFPTLEKALKEGCTSDFKYVEGKTTQTLPTMIANMKTGLGMLTKVTKAKAEIVTLKVKGNTATGTIKHMMAGTTTGPDKKTHTMTFEGTSSNVYVNKGGKWKLSKMTFLSQKMTQDGKPMTGMGGG